jgi:hypothetical protein
LIRSFEVPNDLVLASIKGMPIVFIVETAYDEYISNKKEDFMKLSRPKEITWWIAVIAGVLGILGNVSSIPIVSPYAFWFVAFGFVLLALGTLLKGL